MPAQAVNDKILRSQLFYGSYVKIFVSSMAVQLKLKEGNLIYSVDDDLRDQ